MNSKRLTLNQWSNIFHNIKETVNDEDYILNDEWITISWLDSTNEYILHFENEVFEDGFKTEEEAYNRLHSLEQQIL